MEVTVDKKSLAAINTNGFEFLRASIIPYPVSEFKSSTLEVVNVGESYRFLQVHSAEEIDHIRFVDGIDGVMDFIEFKMKGIFQKHLKEIDTATHELKYSRVIHDHFVNPTEILESLEGNVGLLVTHAYNNNSKEFHSVGEFYLV